MVVVVLEDACWGEPVVPFSHRRQVAVGGGRQTAPVAQSERESSEWVRERVSVSVVPSGLRDPTSPPFLFYFSFFLAQLTSFN